MVMAVRDVCFLEKCTERGLQRRRKRFVIGAVKEAFALLSPLQPTRWASHTKTGYKTRALGHCSALGSAQLVLAYQHPAHWSMGFQKDHEETLTSVSKSRNLHQLQPLVSPNAKDPAEYWLQHPANTQHCLLGQYKLPHNSCLTPTSLCEIYR